LIDATLMIEPRPCASIRFPATWQQRASGQIDVHHLLESASSALRRSDSVETALLISTLRLPERRCHRDHGPLDGSPIADVELDIRALDVSPSDERAFPLEGIRDRRTQSLASP
jgi:hypothetical protein